MRKTTQTGFSLVELMIAITLGLMVLAALASVFANSSRQRGEMERASRNIENGRYAMELLSDDLRLAGFYGELNVKQPSLFPVPGVLPDPCSTAQPDWIAGIPLHVQAYDNGKDLPAGCTPPNLAPDTDVLVVRRLSTCEAGINGCPAVLGGKAYMQISKCATEVAGLAAIPYVMGLSGGTVFNRTMKNCAAAAGIRQYFVRIYYIATDNGNGQPIPTLKRWDFDGALLTETPLVEGIEQLNIEYGIDWDGDGAPNAYTADPTTYASVPCAALCGPVLNWANVVTARIYLLSRNIEATPNFADPKTYSLGKDAGGLPIDITPGGPYKRHAYTGLVRVINAAERRDVP